MINAETQLYGLIGDPVSKSLSPFIHNYVFQQLGVNKRYMAFQVKSEALDKGLEGMKILGFGGFNATLPHKIDLLNQVDELDLYAQGLQAINTVKIQDQKLKGFNTDGPGLVQSLLDHKVPLTKASVLILGAGGAARGIALALAFKGCASIGIMNRTYAKAEALAAMINQSATDAKGFAVELEADLKTYDVVINTTSVGMYPQMDESPLNVERLRKDTVLFDIVYKPHTTQFLKDGLAQGNPVIHGIEMLIYQALIADEIWLDLKLDKVKLKNELVDKAKELGLLMV